jgi:hypothetical protein
MKILAATQFKEASYNRMKEVGFKDNQIVDTARYAKRYGLDANKAAEISADSVRVFGGDDEQERKRWRDMIHEHQHDPEHAGKRQKLRDALQERSTHHDPAHRDQARRHLEQLDEVDKARAKADRKAENAGRGMEAADRRVDSAGASERRAEIKEERKATDAARLANTTDDLNSPPPPSPAAPHAQTKHAEGHSPNKPAEPAVKTAEAQKQEPSKPGQSNPKVAQAASPRPG